MKTLLELADDYAKAYFMGRGDEQKSLLQAAIKRAEVAAMPWEQRCELCGYLHGHSIGCTNNPVDIALRCQQMPLTLSMKDQLRDEYRSGLDSPDNTPEEEE